MTVSRNRDIARILGKTETNNTSNLRLTHTGDGSGLVVYATKENLPTTGLTSGDQAFVTNTSRLYISNGSGWYNVALINATPSLTIDPTGTIALAKDGSTPTVITLTATDSDNAIDGLALSVDSDGSFGGLATISQDSSVFTITPLSADSATTTSSTLTFKASDGISFGSGQRTLSLTFATANSNSTTLLSKADTAGTDNQVDASTSAHTITEIGNVTSTAFTPYHPGGYSTYFDGNGDYLQIPDNDGFELDGDFTIECWFNKSSYASGTYTSLFGGNGSGSNGWNIYITNSNGAISFFHGSFLLTYTEAITNNAWYHVAVARSGTSLKLFVNGVERHAVTNSTTFNQNDANTGTRIGYDIGANAYFVGYIRDARVVKGTAVYTSAFTPPTSPLTAISGTSLLACHLPYIADGSTNSHAITAAGNTQTRRFAPYDYLGYTKAVNAGSVYFDGTGDGIEIASAAATQFGTGEWTIEGWFYPYDQAATTVLLYGYENAYATTPGTFELYVGTNGAQTTPQINGNNGSWATSATSIGSSKTFQYETWNHIVWSRSGNNLRIFVNGKSGANHAISASQTYDQKRSESQFFDKDGASEFRGYVSDFRIVKGDAVYTSDFTPPTAPLTAITNTELLTCTNKNDIWEQADGKPFTKVSGGPTVSNTQRKFTTSSALYFAGTSNTYLLKDLGETIGTRDFTVEAWVYPTTTGAQHVFQISNQSVGYQSITTQNTQVGIGMNGGFWRYGTTGWNFGYVHTTTAVVVNTWHHVAYVRTGGYSKLYLNGTEIHSNADTVNYSARYLAYGVGHFSNNVWYGYTQGLRVSLGYARYTGAFTPPTTEFEG